MLNSIDKAIEIAAKAHKGQVDKSGVAYIEHPMTVASLVNGDKAKIVALLHDTIEDTDITAEYLLQYFDNEIVKAIELLTKARNTEYFRYLGLIKENSLAKMVKLADLSHNMDISRLNTITPKDLQRLDKYKKAYAFLSE